MIDKLHARLKQLYPINEMCHLIDAHFARLDGLEQRVCEVLGHELASNGSALLEGMTFLVQQLQEQQRLYQELEQKRDRDYALTRKISSLVESVNTALAAPVTRSDERGAQFAAVLEQLAKPFRQLAARTAERISAEEAWAEQRIQSENRMLQEFDCLRQHLADLGELVRDLESRHTEQTQQIFDRLAKMSERHPNQNGTPAEPAGTPGNGRVTGALQPAVSSTAIVIRPGHFELENPDITLLTHLAPLLTNRTALDIGANIGAVSGRLLAAGYEVFAFEPFAPSFVRLNGSFGNDERFHAHQLAIGYSDTTMELHVAEDLSPESKYGNVTVYHSLMPHSLPSDLRFGSTVEVRVRSLDSLTRAKIIPAGPGLIKIDTEGYDLEVVRGMGDCSSEVLLAEFWDSEMVFGKSGAMNRLSDLVGELRQRGYCWHIVVYRTPDRPISFYSNQSQSVRDSWGNAVFFKDRGIFDEALHWCSAVLPPTYFAP
jgi:FkbM family methyltransferase